MEQGLIDHRSSFHFAVLIISNTKPWEGQRQWMFIFCEDSGNWPELIDLLLTRVSVPLTQRVGRHHPPAQR